MAKQPYLECGFIQNTHGTRGVLRVQCWCDSPRVLLSLPELYLKSGEIYRPYHNLGGSAAGGDLVLLKLEGVAIGNTCTSLIFTPAMLFRLIPSNTIILATRSFEDFCNCVPGCRK